MADDKDLVGAQGVSGAIRSGIFEAGHPAHELVPAADGPMPIEGRLRKAPLRVPENFEACSGFTLFVYKLFVALEISRRICIDCFYRSCPLSYYLSDNL